MENALPILFVVLGAPLLIALLILVARSNKKRWLDRVAQLNESDEYDLVQLYKWSFVSARATGQTITQINAEVHNLTDKRLRVIIRPGTYFVSSGDHQNMVIRTEHRFLLYQQETERLHLPASCIDAELPIPGEDDGFSGVAKVSEDLTRFLERSSGEDAMVIQAGVWAITDGYSQDQIQDKLVARSSRGDTRPAVSGDQVARARRILNELRIRNYL